MTHILIVDDDLSPYGTFSQRLEASGHSIDFLTDNQQTLEFLRSSPDRFVVVLNHRPPVMDGLQMLTSISQEPDLTLRHRFMLLTFPDVPFLNAIKVKAQQTHTTLIFKPFRSDILSGIVRLLMFGPTKPVGQTIVR